MENIRFDRGDGEILERVKPLWEKLRQHHWKQARFFKHHYETLTFETRLKHFTEEDVQALLVDLAYDENCDLDVGYCVTTLSTSGVGEIESLYVEAAYRKFGLGDALMNRALAWLDEQGAKSRVLSVAEGNENVFSFYRRFGFYPHETMLKYIPPQDRVDEP